MGGEFLKGFLLLEQIFPVLFLLCFPFNHYPPPSSQIKTFALSLAIGKGDKRPEYPPPPCSVPPMYLWKITPFAMSSKSMGNFPAKLSDFRE
jgi:hypothetical protein